MNLILKLGLLIWIKELEYLLEYNLYLISKIGLVDIVYCLL